MKIIVPSANAENLKECIAAINVSDPGAEIIAIDDGARAGAGDLAVQWIDGQKPFIYARNVNLGINAAGRDDVILIGDDVKVFRGSLADLAKEALAARTGACSAGVVGMVCNPKQHPALCSCGGFPTAHVHGGVRRARSMIAFVCVFIPRRAIDAIGLLDERFDGYGFDDNDYCRRLTDAGYSLGVTDACLVDHQSLPSSFRTQEGWISRMDHNRALFEAKHYGT